jgi:glycosyltransferase involved in cell wall biosynthesis
MGSSPLVSIIVPCYNYGHLLSETLSNICLQVFENWECIIVDDGSTDNTKQVANAFVQKDIRFKYLFQKNQGLSAARNSGIHHSKGKFIQLLDADDFIEKNKLQLQLAVFETNADIDIVYSEARFFYSEAPNEFFMSLNGDQVSWMPFADSSDQENLKTTLIKINICVVNAPLIRKEVFDKIGDFNTKLKSVEDWEYWCRCAYSGVKFRFDNGQDTKALVRLHANSMSRSIKGMMEAACIARATLKELILADKHSKFSNERLLLNLQEKSYLHKTLFDIYKQESNRKNAFRHLREYGKIKNEKAYFLKETVKLFIK